MGARRVRTRTAQTLMLRGTLGFLLLMGVFAGTAQADAWFPRILSGEAILALAVDEGPRHDPDAIALMHKLSRKSRKRWPEFAVPEPGAVPPLPPKPAPA